jgi:hypothetical protein
MSIRTRIQQKLHRLMDRFSGEFSAGSEAVHPAGDEPATPTEAPLAPEGESKGTRRARLRRPRGDAGISRR